MPLATRPRAVLIDLAGVLHDGDHEIAGSRAALARLRAAGVPLRFLTNTTRSPRATIHQLLSGLGFALQLDEIQTAAQATRSFVELHGLKPHYLVHPALDAEMGASDPNPDTLVLGDAGPRFNYENLNRAFRLVMGGARFLAMARNRYFKEPDGLSLDMGAFVTGLEFSSGRKAEILGKPAAAFFETGLAELGVAASDAVLIGDDLHDDIGGAQAAGLKGILVRTGKFRPADEQDAAVRPALIADDFAAAVDRLLTLPAS